MRVLLLILLLAGAAWAQTPAVLNLPDDSAQWFVSSAGHGAVLLNKSKLTINGETIEADEIIPARDWQGNFVLFAGDGQSYSYLARKANKWTLWWNKTPVKADVDGGALPTFVPISQKLAFVYKKKKERWVYMAGRDLPVDDGYNVESLRISPDGRVAGYSASNKAGKWYVTMSSSVWRLPAGQKADSLLINRDGTQAAWIERGSAGTYPIASGKHLGPYFQVSPPVFSPDGLHLAFVILEQQNAKSSILLDGEVVSRAGEDLTYPVWDASDHLNYRAGDRRAWDGVRPISAEGAPQFWAGSHLLLISDNHEVLMDSRKSLPADEVRQLQVWPDGSVHYAARRGREIFWEVLP